MNILVNSEENSANVGQQASTPYSRGGAAAHTRCGGGQHGLKGTCRHSAAGRRPCRRRITFQRSASFWQPRRVDRGPQSTYGGGSEGSVARGHEGCAFLCRRHHRACIRGLSQWLGAENALAVAVPYSAR